MRADFTNDKKDEIIYHLKRGPIIVAWKTLIRLELKPRALAQKLNISLSQLKTERVIGEPEKICLSIR